MGVSLGNPNEILEIIKRHIFLSIYLFFHELKYLSFANILKKNKSKQYLYINNEEFNIKHITYEKNE